MWRSGGLKCEMRYYCEQPAAQTTNCHLIFSLSNISYLRTVVHWASWNCSTMVSRAGSMYQMLAKIKEMMERLAMLQTTPISTSSNQAVRFDHCLAQNSLQPRLWSRRRGELELTRLLFLFQWTQQFSAGHYSAGTAKMLWRYELSSLTWPLQTIFYFQQSLSGQSGQDKYNDLWFIGNLNLTIILSQILWRTGLAGWWWCNYWYWLLCLLQNECLFQTVLHGKSPWKDFQYDHNYFSSNVYTKLRYLFVD